MIQGNTGARLSRGVNPMSLAPSGRIGLPPVGATPGEVQRLFNDIHTNPLGSEYHDILGVEKLRMSESNWKESNEYLNQPSNGKLSLQASENVYSSDLRGMGDVSTTATQVASPLIGFLGKALIGVVAAYMVFSHR